MTHEDQFRSFQRHLRRDERGDDRRAAARPVDADGALYGVASDGSIYRIHSGDGKVTPLSRIRIGNAGTLTMVNAIAMTGGTKEMRGGDIITDPRGMSDAFVVRGSRLFKIAIPSGQISLRGQIGPKDNVDFVDVAVVRQD